MKYHHQHGILHRDLKPENILLDENFYPKISDFGLSRCFPVIFTRSIQLTMSGVRGTPLYMAPEMIRGERCGTGVDVYSLAIIIYELMTGDVPFRHIGEQLTVYRIWNEVNSGHRPIFRDNISQNLKDLITACWSPNPSERPTFDRLLNPIREKLQTNDLNYLLYAACESSNSNLVRNLISDEAIDINSRIIPF